MQARGVLPGDGHLPAVSAVPHRDAVAPPKLAADAPVLDIFQPVVIHLGETFGHDADAPIPHRLQGGVGQRLDFDKPLGRDHRLDDLTAALRAGHVELVGLLLEHQPGEAHIFPQLFASIEAIQPLVGAAVGIDTRGFIQDGDDRQAVALADGIIVGVVPGGHFERAAAELAVDIFIGDDRDEPPQHRHADLASDQLLVALVFGMNRHGGIAQDGLGPGGGNRQDKRCHPPAYI